MRLKTNLLHRLFAICLLCMSAAITAVAQTDDFDVLMKRISTDFRRNPGIDGSLKKFNAAEGSFNDIDYSRDDRTNWPPQQHVDRVEQWASAYTNPRNKNYGSEALYANIVKALQFWQDRNPNCNNWWYNQIAEPQALGVTLILMRDGKKQVPAELEKSILDRMRKEGGDPAKWTGANRTDICLHWIYRSCLERNEADLNKAMQLVFDPIRYTTREGFQHDNSYFQHGVQLYIGGYGDEILKGVTQVAMYALGTKYALADDKVQLVSKFMRDTYFQTMRGKYMMYDVMGRSVSRRNILDKSQKALFARRMIKLDPKHAGEFRQIVARLTGKQPVDYAVKPRHTHYFRGDYTLHVRPGYMFDVRLVSNRTARLEYGNGENLKTYFASDGCNSLVKRGDEYYNIFPVWNWTLIPGTTAPQANPIPKAKSDWQQAGTSQFAGGVSDSLYGVTAYAYDDLWAGIDMHAKKSWFFFDDEIVCLGAGITCGNANPVLTSVNQCLAAKDATMQYGAETSGKTPSAASSPIDEGGVRWVMYDGVAYIFPNGAKVKAGVAEQKGSWYDINHTQPKGEVRKNVFSLAIDHGVKPKDATYAYIVVPEAGTADAVARYGKKGCVSILSNTPALQAVEQTKLGVWQAVFYEAGEYKDKNITLRVDKPCTVMVRRMADGTVTLHVADPAQKQQPINVGVQLKGVLKKLVSTRCDFTGTGIYAGATKAYRLK